MPFESPGQNPLHEIPWTKFHEQNSPGVRQNSPSHLNPFTYSYTVCGRTIELASGRLIRQAGERAIRWCIRGWVGSRSEREIGWVAKHINRHTGWRVNNGQTVMCVDEQTAACYVDRGTRWLDG